MKHPELEQLVKRVETLRAARQRTADYLAMVEGQAADAEHAIEQAAASQPLAGAEPKPCDQRPPIHAMRRPRRSRWPTRRSGRSR